MLYSETEEQQTIKLKHIHSPADIRELSVVQLAGLAVESCGDIHFGSGVLELFSRKKLYNIATCSLAHPDMFIEHGPQNILLKNSNLDIHSIVRAAINLMKY